MRGLGHWALIGAVALSLAACGVAHRAYRNLTGEEDRPRVRPIAGPPAAPTPLILVSIDGFRADYLDRGMTPNLKALAEGGARAERMLPSFPSITFPNHYTLVTGRVPDHNGIVDNTFLDPNVPTGVFKMANSAAVTSGEPWEQATPIWVTAEQAGIHTGTEFWPGSEAPIHGVRPGLYSKFDKGVTSDERVDKVLSWLDLPADKRPGFLTLYFDIVDTAGHHFGPDSPEVNTAAATVDSAIGRLEAGLKARGITANLIIVADHGMAAVPPSQHIHMDQWADPNGFTIVSGGAVAGLVPTAPDASTKLLASHPHATCYLKNRIPKRFQYGANPRVPPIVCIAETGWFLTTSVRDAQEKSPILGEHGYDNADPQMGALFIANGPLFLKHVVLKPFPNTDVYPLMARLLDLTPEPNDGHVEDLYPALR